MPSPYTDQLPRLLYIGDVPVESGCHGSEALYRLLQNYPCEKLAVVETEPYLSVPQRRLPKLSYKAFAIGAKNWHKTRFFRWAGSWLSVKTPISAMRLRRFVTEFNPEAVVTVAHGYSWLAAARVADECKLPLHLIVHDSPLTMMATFSWLMRWQERQFEKIYRQACSRLCVSPYMEEEYRRKYGVSGEVLYPSRAKDCPAFDLAPQTYGKKNGPLVGAYAGSIFRGGDARLILILAQCLEERGGRLLLFGPNSSQSLKYWGLNRNNIVLQGMVEDLVPRLRNEVDFLFVPTTFELDGNQSGVTISFPSKLTDYTATGLPLLVCGPDYCSAVRWAISHGRLAEVVTTEAKDALAAAVDRLGQVDNRINLGQAAKRAGDRLFAHSACVETFYRALALGSGMSMPIEISGHA
jgi:Glycosyltransferase Family 4